MSTSVKRIDRRTVHQICSGQVVLSLAVAVKELVENSLDAGATNIEIRLREHGSELVEVSDNGSGVCEENFEGLTLKHHTSKIKDFSDLEVGVATFGFRGEALSSLCALCELTVTTRHSSAAVGTRIEYDHDGHIRTKVSAARETGTTVSLRNLFQPLPVRHKEFTRNIKKEFNRMIQLLQGYCIISTNVRIVCFNQVAKSGKQLILSTTGNHSVKENIVNCFGLKQFRQLVEVTQCRVDELREEDLAGAGIKAEALGLFKLSGYISHCLHGYGRSAADRQFYFFNSRPCDHSKLSKTVNEVYHVYNRHQYPFVALNISTAREHVDVNVTPDKRQVMLHQEKAMLSLVKLSLTKLFEPLQEELQASQLNISKGSLGTPSPLLSSVITPPPSTSSLARLKRSCPSSGDDKDTCYQRKTKQARLVDYGSAVAGSSPHDDSATMEVSFSGTADLENPLAATRSLETDQRVDTAGQQSDQCLPQPDLPSPQYQSSALTTEGKSRDTLNLRSVQTKDSVGDSELEPSSTETEREAHGNGISCPDCSPSVGRAETDRGGVEKKDLLSMAVDFDLMLTSERLAVLSSSGERLLMEEEGTDGRRFRAKINPSSNSQAEEELRKQISKADFLKMKILGQFNLGFILTKLDTDLFIVDQHASDEKYNFERLQRDTIIQHQRLIQPKALELTAVGENIVIDNLDVFKKNGFQFEIDHEAMPTKRVKLVGQPVSKNWSLGPKDIDELIFMLSDGIGSGEVVRPTSVRAMFASRACRSSIMIGTALSNSDMRKLIDHMAEMDQPWCCPHNRPTMRHVIDLSRVHVTKN